MPMLEGEKTLKKEEVAEMEGQEKGKEWQLELGHQKGSSLSKNLLTLKNGHEREERLLPVTKIGGRDISFDDRLLNTILGTPKNVVSSLKSSNTLSLILFELVITLVLEKSTINIPLKEWVIQKMRKEQETMNVDEEESEEEPKEETFRRKMRQKKRLERVEEGQSSENMSQIINMIAALTYKMHYVDDALYVDNAFMIC
ncbi:hypothetical protein M9H77_15956 [Catharanthus roseus]|uniref:Uncharacterized protein n=1 Tax=Catharanthus roseus TaxID=4058 RepID=A0ACC0AYL6_CATRO|nr:hypothetical protein M9H77_15956 [Catharanthus roseus]